MDNEFCKVIWHLIYQIKCADDHFYFNPKAPITTAADDMYKYFFIVFQRNKT